MTTITLSDCNEGIPETRILNAQDHLSTLAALDCPICLNILWKPVVCLKCRTNFCYSCINKWMKNRNNKSKMCPIQCKFEMSNSPETIKSSLALLKIKCKYEGKGCSESFGYNELDKHEQDCKHADVFEDPSFLSFGNMFGDTDESVLTITVTE